MHSVFTRLLFNWRVVGLNEAACGGGRYALARSNSFPFQLGGSSTGRVVIEKRFLPEFGSIAIASAAKQQAASFRSRYRKSAATCIRLSPLQNSPRISDER